MKFIKRCWQFIKKFSKRNEKVITGAILGSLITLIVGIYVNYKIQQDITERTNKFEIHKRNLDRREKIFVEVHKLVSQHMFSLDRFTWAYPVKSIKYQKLNRYWEDYVDNLRRWDIEFSKYQALIGIYYSKNLEDEFSQISNKFQNTRKEIRRYWMGCAVNPCTWNKRKSTLGPIKNAKKETKTNECIEKGKIINLKKNTIDAYIKCIVAEMRNSVNTFSKKLVKAHKKNQRQSDSD